MQGKWDASRPFVKGIQSLVPLKVGDNYLVPPLQSSMTSLHCASKIITCMVDGSHGKGSTWWGFLDMHVPSFAPYIATVFLTTVQCWKYEAAKYVHSCHERQVLLYWVCRVLRSNTPYHPENAPLPHLVGIALRGWSDNTVFSVPKLTACPVKCFSFAFNTCFLPHVKISMHTLCIQSKVRLHQLYNIKHQEGSTLLVAYWSKHTRPECTSRS